MLNNERSELWKFLFEADRLKTDAKIFYVYEHRHPNGVCFYVGKGKGKRAYSERGRSHRWWEFRNRFSEYAVAIVATGLTELDAFKVEAERIRQHGIDSLANNWKHQKNGYYPMSLEESIVEMYRTGTLVSKVETEGGFPKKIFFT